MNDQGELIDLDAISQPQGESKPAKLTERDMLNLVHRRYAHAFNGLSPRYIVAEHVRFHPTWGQRTLDVIVSDTWPSDGYAMHGIEVKCSRSDLKREVDNLAKSETFTEHLDYFWIAVSDPKVLSGLELPGAWGVLCASTGKLRVRKPARRLRDLVGGSYDERDPMPRQVQVAMLRATRKTYERLTERAEGLS